MRVHVFRITPFSYRIFLSDPSRDGYLFIIKWVI